jgi:aminoglycoside phosphotransferase (APT) family kinase protein
VADHARDPVWYVAHGWLPLVLPADARRIRVGPLGVRAMCRSAGVALVEEGADAEIAAVGELRGDTDVVMVPLDAAQAEGGSRPVRLVRRARGFADVRAQAAFAQRRLGELGYAHVDVLWWDLGQSVRVTGMPPPDGRRLAERLPQRAVVVGWRAARRPTLLEAALRQARERSGLALAPESAVMRTTPLITTREAVVRVAVGAARAEIDARVAALAAIDAARPDARVTERIPAALGRGEYGMAEWFLEQRLPGSNPRSLTDALLAESIDFLVALHSCDGEPRTSAADQGDLVAATCGPEDATAVRRLAGWVEEVLADVPRGLAHGDFTLRNLLTQGERLVGVVDWDSSGPGRFPLIDLLHLRLDAKRLTRPDRLGHAIVEDLLPWAAAGGDATARTYCRRLGFDATPARLLALVAAYWLDRAAYQAVRFPARAQRPAWLRSNVSETLPPLLRAGDATPRTA